MQLNGNTGPLCTSVGTIKMCIAQTYKEQKNYFAIESLIKDFAAKKELRTFENNSPFFYFSFEKYLT